MVILLCFPCLGCFGGLAGLNLSGLPRREEAPLHAEKLSLLSYIEFQLILVERNRNKTLEDAVLAVMCKVQVFLQKFGLNDFLNDFHRKDLCDARPKPEMSSKFKMRCTPSLNQT